MMEFILNGGPYSFTKDGRLQLEEYYPNATFETYKGVDAYIYYIDFHHAE